MNNHRIIFRALFIHKTSSSVFTKSKPCDVSFQFFFKRKKQIQDNRPATDHCSRVHTSTDPCHSLYHFRFRGACRTARYVRCTAHTVRCSSVVTVSLLAAATYFHVLYAWKFRSCIIHGCLSRIGSLVCGFGILKSYDDGIIIAKELQVSRGDINRNKNGLQEIMTL